MIKLNRKKLVIILTISGSAFGSIFSWNDIKNVNFSPIYGVNYLCRSTIQHDDKKPAYTYGFVVDDNGHYKCQMNVAASSTFRNNVDPVATNKLASLFIPLNKTFSEFKSFKLYGYKNNHFSVLVDRNNALVNVNLTSEQISQLITYNIPHYPKPIGQVSRLYYHPNRSEILDISRPPRAIV